MDHQTQSALRDATTAAEAIADENAKVAVLALIKAVTSLGNSGTRATRTGAN